MKKLIIILLAALSVINVNAKQKVMVYIFTKAEEPISTSAVNYFKDLKDSEYGEYFDYENIEVWDKDWHEDEVKSKIVNQIAEYYEDVLTGAPYIVIGNKYRLATFTEDYISEINEAIMTAYYNDNYEDFVKKARNEIETKKTKDAIAISIITILIVLVPSIFIILAKKNNGE